MTNADPFSQVLDRLWYYLEGNAGFRAMVKPGNRIKLTRADGINPFKESLSQADLPQCEIEPSGGLFQPFARNTDCRAVQKFTVKLTTGDLRVNMFIFPFKWAVMRAMASAPANLGLPFITAFSLGDLAEDAGEAARDATGWYVKLVISVEMWFAKTTMQDPITIGT